MRRLTRAPVLRACLAAVALAGCTSGGTADPWARSYLVSAERVNDAVLEVIEDAGFHVDEADEDRGRIRARSSARRGDDISLLVRVETGAVGTVVSVMAGSSEARDGRGAGPLDQAVRDLLERLDDRLGAPPG